MHVTVCAQAMWAYTEKPQNPMIEDTCQGDPNAEVAPQTAVGLPEPALAAEAISRVLQPLARLMIDHGLQLPSLVDLLKKALVDEAAGAYGLAD